MLFEENGWILKDNNQLSNSIMYFKPGNETEFIKTFQLIQKKYGRTMDKPENKFSIKKSFHFSRGYE